MPILDIPVSLTFRDSVQSELCSKGLKNFCPKISISASEQNNRGKVSSSMDIS